MSYNVDVAVNRYLTEMQTRAAEAAKTCYLGEKTPDWNRDFPRCPGLKFRNTYTDNDLNPFLYALQCQREFGEAEYYQYVWDVNENRERSPGIHRALRLAHLTPPNQFYYTSDDTLDGFINDTLGQVFEIPEWYQGYHEWFEDEEILVHLITLIPTNWRSTCLFHYNERLLSPEEFTAKLDTLPEGLHIACEVEDVGRYVKYDERFFTYLMYESAGMGYKSFVDPVYDKSDEDVYHD